MASGRRNGQRMLTAALESVQALSCAGQRSALPRAAAGNQTRSVGMQRVNCRAEWYRCAQRQLQGGRVKRVTTYGRQQLPPRHGGSGPMSCCPPVVPGVQVQCDRWERPRLAPRTLRRSAYRAASRAAHNWLCSQLAPHAVEFVLSQLERPAAPRDSRMCVHTAALLFKVWPPGAHLRPCLHGLWQRPCHHTAQPAASAGAAIKKLHRRTSAAASGG